ncbi:MAG: translational GTPase TypA [Myxococcales bacterium]|nr:translational GTPase TypA [Myxococcales bacterium]
MNLRNLAIIAHVDHGKTTLVDFLLKQSGTFRANEHVADRVMDSMDLERERGITIMAKVASIHFGDTKINIVDTPGHADFGGEVERTLKMVDAAILLVDASEGPLPQTRFVLRKALEQGLAILVCVNKIDRPDARVQEVVNEVYDLFIDLGADEKQIEFPLLYAVAREGWCTATYGERNDSLLPMFEAIIKHVPPPKVTLDGDLQAMVNQLDYDNYVGRLAIVRVATGAIREKTDVALVGADGIPKKVRVSSLFQFEGMRRVPAAELTAGDIGAIAGIPDVNVGDSFCALEDPRPLPRLKVDEPTIGMTFSANTSGLSGREGKYVTARQIRERLEKEMMMNPALKMEETGSVETMRIFGRGELQLGILIETMRREGFELSVSRPEVKMIEENGVQKEPYEVAQLDFPEQFMGVVTQKMATRKGRMTEMKMDGSSRVRLFFRIPSRGLIGFRGEYLNDTRGQGLLNTLFDGYDVHAGFIQSRNNGSLISDRTGEATTYALFHLQPRGRMFIHPQTQVYEGMIVGENSRDNDLNIDCTREKQLNNIRSAGADEKQILVPPIQMSLEKALEYIAEDELVEITPSAIRLRKKELRKNMRSVVRGERD